MPWRYADLSHTITDGLVTYPGLPAPVISDHLSREASRERYAPGTEFQIGRIEMVANTGTYLDSPFHRYADGTDVAGLDLARLADLPAVVVRATGIAGRAVDRHLVAAALAETDAGGAAVLIETGWGDAHWGSEAYFEGHPYLTEAAAQELVSAGPALVGVDTYNIDDTGDLRRPAHSILLGAGIPIVEHLCRLGSCRSGARDSRRSRHRSTAWARSRSARTPSWTSTDSRPLARLPEDGCRHIAGHDPVGLVHDLADAQVAGH